MAVLPTCVRQVLQFVRVLRTVDIPEEQQQDIVIVAGDADDVDAKHLLRMFQRVFIVLVPSQDEGFLSVKTLRSLNIKTASHCVLTANAGQTQEEIEKYDNHKMCLRMVTCSMPMLNAALTGTFQVIRQITPTCICLMEVEDIAHARFFLPGSRVVNPWSDDPEMQAQNSIMSQKWVNRDSAVNRAACSSNGHIVEEVLY